MDERNGELISVQVLGRPFSKVSKDTTSSSCMIGRRVFSMGPSWYENIVWNYPWKILKTGKENYNLFFRDSWKTKGKPIFDKLRILNLTGMPVGSGTLSIFLMHVVQLILFEVQNLNVSNEARLAGSIPMSAKNHLEIAGSVRDSKKDESFERICNRLLKTDLYLWKCSV